MMSIKKIAHRGLHLHYRISGSGRPVMLIHGFAEDGSAWQMISEFLSKDYLVIVPDLPGTGMSAGSIADFSSMEDFALAIKSVLDAEQIKRLAIIGHSMGGYIAMAMFELFPEMFSGIGLFHSTAFGDDLEKQRNRDRYSKFMSVHGAAAFLNTSIPGLFANPTLHEKYIESQIAGAIETGTENLITYYQAMKGRPDRSALLKKSEIPVLIVAGKSDQTVPLNQSLNLSKLPAICHFHILNYSAHMGFIEEPEKSRSILLFFLQHIHFKH